MGQGGHGVSRQGGEGLDETRRSWSVTAKPGGAGHGDAV